MWRDKILELAEKTNWPSEIIVDKKILDNVYFEMKTIEESIGAKWIELGIAHKWPEERGTNAIIITNNDNRKTAFVGF